MNKYYATKSNQMNQKLLIIHTSRSKEHERICEFTVK